MPSYAQPAVLLTDTDSSSAVRDPTTAYKNRVTALFVPLCCCQHGSEPAQPNRTPIDLTASAASASGSLQATLSKLPRPRHQCATASHLGAVPIGIYRLSVLIDPQQIATLAVTHLNSLVVAINFWRFPEICRIGCLPSVIHSSAPR